LRKKLVDDLKRVVDWINYGYHAPGEWFMEQDETTKLLLSHGTVALIVYLVDQIHL
jgi:hypothetical protein